MSVLRPIGVVAVAMLLVLALGAPVSEARGGGHGGGGHGGGRGRGFSHHGHFHGHGRVIVGVAPWWGVGWWDPWWYPPAYYSSYPYYDPLAAEPPVYIERGPGSEAPAAGYWYYCESAGRYYPDVQGCPEPWVKVPPREG
jgi:hypothetical protein